MMAIFPCSAFQCIQFHLMVNRGCSGYASMNEDNVLYVMIKMAQDYFFSLLRNM